LADFFACLGNPCHPVDNPGGYVALCIAENKLITGELSKRLCRSSVAEAAFGDAEYFCYNDFLGMPDVRSTVAQFLTRKFWRPTSSDVCMDPQHVILSSGCAASLNNLFYTLAEEKEAVLIPAPYYCAFESDMKVFAQCVPIPVPSANPVQGPTVEELEAAAQLAESVGGRFD
jgi:1-aminocyclopropane-1-carboxylate synthase